MSDRKLTFIRPNVLKIPECNHLEKNPQGLLTTAQAGHEQTGGALYHTITDEKARKFLLELVGGIPNVKNPKDNLAVRAEASRFVARVQVTQYVINRASKMEGGLTFENLQKAYQEFQQTVKNDKHLKAHFDKIFDKDGKLKLDNSLFDYKRKIQVGKNKRIIWDHVELEILAPSGVLSVHGQCAKQLDTIIPLVVKNLTNTVDRFPKPAEKKPEEQAPKPEEPKAEPEVREPDFQPAFSVDVSTDGLKFEVPAIPELRVQNVTINGKVFNPSKKEGEILGAALTSAAISWLLRQAVPPSAAKERPPALVPGDSGEPPAQPGPAPVCPQPQPGATPVLPAPGGDGSPPAGDCTAGCQLVNPDAPSHGISTVAPLPNNQPLTGGENPLTGITNTPAAVPPSVTPKADDKSVGLPEGETTFKFKAA